MADLVIRISGDIKNYTEALDKAKEGSESLNDVLGGMTKAAAIGFAALTAEVALSVKAYTESEAAAQELNLALENQGIFSRQLAESYAEQASAIQELTGLDDDAVIAAQAKLQTFIGQTKITKELTSAMVDLSTKSGSLESAAEILGRAYDGNTRGLKAYGIEIQDGLTRQERMAKVIEEVTAKFGGQAEASNKANLGIRGLTAAFSDVQEEIGARFAPIIAAGIAQITGFFKAIRENKALLDLTAAIIGAGIAVTGLIGALGTIGIALVSLKAIVAALGVTTAATLGPLALVAAAVVGLGAAVGIYAVSSSKAKTATEELDQQIRKTEASIESMRKKVENALPWEVDKPKKKLQELEDKMEALIAKKQKLDAQQFEADKPAAQKKNSIADRKAEQEKMEQAAARAHRDVLVLEASDASKEMIDIAKEEAAILAQIADEKNTAIRDQLIAHLKEVKALENNAINEETEQKIILREEALEQNEEYQLLTEEQKKVFLDKNKMMLQESIMTDNAAQQQAALNRAKLQIDNNNRFIIEQQKYGVAYAAINKVMHSEIYNGSKQAFGELAQLTQSSNATLKSIGKAAAVANIIIKTAESAMAIFAGFSTIPIVGPALGVAGAAAAVAFGAEQVGRVTSAADGGIITGGIPGVDSVPAMLMPGELVVPERNFDEVVGSVASGRGSGGGEGGQSAILIGFDGPESESVLTARQVEGRALGTFRGAS